MSKRERRLWLGDWQRDADGDTFAIVPDDDSEPAPATDSRRTLMVGVAAGALLLLLVLVLLAGGNSTTPQPRGPSAFTPAPQAPVQPPQGAAPQGGFGGPDLTGAGAEKAAQAALQKYPGQIERVTGDGSGGYIVHVFTPDGYELHVQVDRGFHVEGSDGGGGAGSGPNTLGPGGTTQ